MKKILTTLLFTTLFMTLFASIDININVETPILRGGSFSKELPLLMKVGEPKIPYVKAKVLLPQGEIITDTKVVFTELTNYRRDLEVEYTKQQQPTSVREIIATERNEAIYTSNKAYPHTDYELLGIQKMNGYSFAIYNIYPYKYNPITKSFDYYNNIELSLETESNSKSLEESASKVIDSEIVFKKLNYDFYNIEARSSYKYSYSGTTRNIDLSTPYQMLIITNQNSSELFTEYVNWKIDNGIPTKLVTVEDIYTYYTGDNEPDIIRNFISDAYSSWAGSSIPLEYVLLGGDDEIIPIRGVWGNVGSYEDNTIPCDTYYGSLDGNWNANNNNVYGEQNDDVDYYPEISVGRIPAETPAEFNNFFNKTYHYVNNNTYSNNIATMFGENLNNNPVTWGGDYKDEIVERMPTDYLMNTHYQRDGNFSTPEVVGAINGGSGIMNHMGHANENTVCGLNGSVINNMLTNDEYGFLFSQGCYPAAFDNATSGGTAGTNEAVAEQFVTAEGGLYAFIGNTRYGWYYPGSTDGASQFFDRSFFDALFEEDIRALGKAQDYCLVDNVNDSMYNSTMRWCYFEIILFGDPSIEVKSFNSELAYLTISDIEYQDVVGDQDGNVNPGETIELSITLENDSNWGAVNSVTVTLENLDEQFTVTSNTATLGSIVSGGSAVSVENIAFDVPNSISFDNFTYSLKVEAYNSANEEIFSRSYENSFDITLLSSSFPWETNVSSKSSPVYLDYNNDGENEIVFLNSLGKITLLNLAGEIILEQEADEEENIFKSFAVTQIEDNTVIVYASRENRIVATEIGGDEIFSFTTENQLIMTPIIIDIDGDGTDEVAALDFAKNLYVIDFNGQALPNFPIQLAAFSVYDFASADLNGDDKDEIVICTSDNKLHAIDYNGANINNFPVVFEQPLKSAPTISNSRIAVSSLAGINIVNFSGEIEATVQTDGIAGSIIANNFNDDNHVDFAFITSTRNVYIISDNGVIHDGFPQEMGLISYAPPLATDVNNDGNVDLICFDSSNNMYIYDNQGALLPGFPFETGLATHTPSTIGDIDDDGTLNVLMGYTLGVAVANLKTTANLESLSWTTYRADYKRTGYFDFVAGTPNNDGQVEPIITSLAGNYPNPFNPETTIFYSLKDAGNVKIDIFNLKGQKVKTVLNDNQISGSHSVVWNGKDSNNKSVSSGVYFYKMKSGKYSKTKKMILMK